jgi:hypothetical protein
MTGAENGDDIVLRADRLYAARTALSEARPARGGLGLADLVQFLTDSQHSLSLEQQRRLFSDPRLRADYRRLKSELAAIEMPALAAASVGDVSERRFPGGTVRMHPSRVAGQVYVFLKFTGAAAQPRWMLLETPGVELVKRVLPNPDPSGEMLIVLDPRNPADEAFLRVLADPTSSGSFLL